MGNGLFGVFVDGEEIGNHVFFKEDSTLLTARIRPKEEWSDEEKRIFTKEDTEEILEPTPAIREPIYLFLFKTSNELYPSLAEGRLLEEQVNALDDKKTMMGDIPTLLKYRVPEFEVEIEQGFFYDIYSTVIKYKGTRAFYTGARVLTEPLRAVINPTFDEVKLLALEHLELTPEQTKNLQAEASYSKTWMSLWKAHCGFMLADIDDIHYGVTVIEYNKVGNFFSHVKNRVVSNEEIRKAIGF